jgi:hypothetical protein
MDKFYHLPMCGGHIVIPFRQWVITIDIKQKSIASDSTLSKQARH